MGHPVMQLKGRRVFMVLESMIWKSTRSALRITLAIAAVSAAAPAARADQWTVPTPEELAMTSQVGAPGASAVYLFREEKTEDRLHMYSEYVRLKVLTDGGKEFANVELKYASGGRMNYTVTDVAGRTIHPDGTIIPFTGKPYERMVAKTQGYQEKAKVFTLPDVTVGSIIEYRYKLRWEDNMYSAPHWIVQTNLYLRKAHFQWYPTDRQLTTSDERGQLVNTIAWMPILPAGTEVKQTALPGAVMGNSREGSMVIDLDVHDIPPSPKEEYMPPIGSLGYRVLFYFTPYRTADEYWKGEDKHWSKGQDRFIGPGPVVGAAVQQLVSPADTQEQKLKKIYAAVEEIENTDYTRQRSHNEDKAEGLSDVKTTDDIWTRKRGSSDQIADLFVAMARASGMKAYAMAVTNRDRSLFIKGYLSVSQLDDDIAIVSVDGKEQFFDPGSRYCPYGHLAWKHTDSYGLRQTDNATDLARTPGEPYTASGVNRVANLTMDETGIVSGRLEMKYIGANSLRWRQKSLTDDLDAVELELKESVEHMLPGGMDVKLTTISKIQDYEQPLTVTFQIKGTIGSATGKRLLIPGDLFEANSRPTFAQDKRELAVWFHFPYVAHDAIRINFPPAFQVESVPPDTSAKLPAMAVYNLKAAADGKGITIRRDLYLAQTVYLPNEYPQLKTFYGQFEAKDQEPIILKVAAPVSPSGN
jgi:hypothetical protein